MKKELFNDVTKSIIMETLLDVRQKNASDLSDKEFLALLNYDPNLYHYSGTSTIDSFRVLPESFIKWLLKMNKSGELSNRTDEQSIEMIRNVLSQFEKLKGRRNLLPNNDINSYHTVQDVINAVWSAQDRLSVNQKNKDARNNQKALEKAEKKPGMYMNGAVELLFNGKDWEVWTPHTYEGSKALRRGAVWCTGGDTDNFYKHYTENGTLYVIMNKKDNSDKYQLFVPFLDRNYTSHEYRDKDNTEKSFRALCRDNPELLQYFQTRSDVIKAYPDLENMDQADREEDELNWTEDLEDEIAYRFDLRYFYDDEIYSLIDLETACHKTKYISKEQILSVMKNGYDEYGIYDDYGFELKQHLTKNGDFMQLFYNTDYFAPLIRMFHHENPDNSFKNTDKDEFKEIFIDAMFATPSPQNQHLYKEITSWLQEKYDNVGGSAKNYSIDVIDNIDSEAYSDYIANYIYEELYRTFDIRVNDLSSDILDTAIENESIPYNTRHYSIREFYDVEVIDRDIQSFNDYCNHYDLYFDDSTLMRDIENWDEFDLYSDSYLDDNCAKLIDLFMTTSEYNEYVDMDDNLINSPYNNQSNSISIPDDVHNFIMANGKYPSQILKGIRRGFFDDNQITGAFYQVMALRGYCQNATTAYTICDIFGFIEGDIINNKEALIKLLELNGNDAKEVIEYNPLIRMWRANMDNGNPDDTMEQQKAYIIKCVPKIQDIVNETSNKSEDKEKSEDNKVDESMYDILRNAGISF